MELQVKRSDFMTALRPLARSVPRHQLGSTAALWVEDGVAVIRFADMEARIPAYGSWPSLVTFRAGFLVVHAEIPPEDDPIKITYRDERIQIGRTSVDCELGNPTHHWPDFVELDPDYTMLDVIEAWLDHSDAELEHSGLASTVETMLDKLDDIFQAGIQERDGWNEYKEAYPGGLAIDGETLMGLLTRAREA